MPEDLAVTLAALLGGGGRVDGLHRLTSGASRETWAFSVGGDELILRRDPPGRPSHPGVMALEAHAMTACARAGLRVPEVLAVDDGAMLGTAGLVMRRVPGETIARRILRDAEYAPARRVLLGDLATFLAGLHALPPADLPGLGTRDPIEAVEILYGKLDDHSPTFDKTLEWVVGNRPGLASDAVVHGDFRLGNVIVDGSGLAAVIDWELVHLGDPLEDLAWLCLKAWRFGQRPEAAGLGAIDELVSRYEGAGGRTVDRETLHWWLVHKTLVWGLGCMVQANTHLTGQVRSAELAAVGRRVAEQEWDLIELLAPDAASAARSLERPVPRPDEPGVYGRPTARELIEAVREFLTDQVMTLPDRGLAYQARVAANVLAVVERELAHPAVARDGLEWATLALSVRDRLVVASPHHLDR